MKNSYKKLFLLILAIILSSGFLYGCAATDNVKTSINPKISKQNLNLLIKHDKSITAFTDAIINPKSVIHVKIDKADVLFIKLYNDKQLLSPREMERAETPGLGLSDLPGYKLYQRFLIDYKAYCGSVGGGFESDIYNNTIDYAYGSLEYLFALIVDKYPNVFQETHSWWYKCMTKNNKDTFAVFFALSGFTILNRNPNPLNHSVYAIILYNLYNYNSYIQRIKNTDRELKRERATERLKNKIMHEKNTVWFYYGHLNTNGLNIKTKFVPISAYKEYSHIHIKLYFINNKNIPLTLNLTKTKTLFIPQSGITYGITWYELSNGFINVDKYGSGCDIANRNTELLINPGADCSISMPVRIPGFNPSVNITPELAFGDNITAHLKPMSEYDYDKIHNAH